MGNMRGFRLSFFAATLCMMPFVSAVAQSERLRFDTPTEINGIELVCTGVGREVRQNPAWNDYALKVEVAGEQGQFLGNIEFEVRRDGESIVEIFCGGPWILAQLKPGSYDVTASFEAARRSEAVSIAPSGQSQLVLRIPNVADAESAKRVDLP